MPPFDRSAWTELRADLPALPGATPGFTFRCWARDLISPVASRRQAANVPPPHSPATHKKFRKRSWPSPKSPPD